MPEIAHPDHPLAGIFPLLDRAGLADLAIDIKQFGLREPIVLLDGAVLDGRNRLRACEMAGVEPAFIPYTGDNPAAYVASLNLHRRHLTESQRGLAASKLSNLEHGGDRRSDQAANLPLETHTPPISQADAAKLLNVSERTVRAAAAVLEKGEPELVTAVERGDISVSAAAEISKLPKALQAAAIEQPDDAAIVAKAVRRQDPSPLAAAREALRPIAEYIIAEVQSAGRRRKPAAQARAPLPDPVVPASTEWVDWTGSVGRIAELQVDLRNIAREMPSTVDRHLGLARAALPRLQTWIQELESTYVDA